MLKQGANQCRDATLSRVCLVWSARNRCENAGATWKRFMKENCKLTCGYCSVDRFEWFQRKRLIDKHKMEIKLKCFYA